MTQATPTYGSFYITYAGGSVLHLSTEFEADCSIHSKVIKGVQKLPQNFTKICKLGHVTLATPAYGSFYNPYAGRVHPLYLYQI